jgi:hypothetical protein
LAPKVLELSKNVETDDSTFPSAAARAAAKKAILLDLNFWTNF